MKKSFSLRAFTLIELLIVVAIIAILAAIAVPNFLEAQIRAKVSRTKSDLRTIVLALESYRVDTNKYPEQGVPALPNPTDSYPFATDVTRVYGGDSPRHAAGNPGIAFRLSTPVAFLASTTAVFSDPFFSGYDPVNTSIVNDTRYYNYSGDYYFGRIYDSTQDPAPAVQGPLMLAMNERNGFHVRGRGPDKSYARRSAGWEDFLTFRKQPGTGTQGDGGARSIYDPTNGSVSPGDVVYIGKGGLQ